MKRILSLGAGVQSSTLALMAEDGAIDPIDAAIFSDTQGEPAAVYEYLAYLRSIVTLFPIYTVSGGNLWESATTVRRTRDGQRTYIKTALPVYMLDGLRKGMGQRHCTRDFKIAPVTKKCRELVGLKRVPQKSGILVKLLMGISTDEADRIKVNPNPWIENEYPLIDKGMSRQDCLSYCENTGRRQPPRSACTFCSFHDDAEWMKLTPAEFSDVADIKEPELQRAYAETSEIDGIPYLHADRVPLRQVNLDVQSAQLNFFRNECEGMCGV